VYSVHSRIFTLASFPKIVDWAVQIADALAYLHDVQRILHRDVKSSNIFLTSGLLKLGDFGIARLLDTEDRATTLAGTPHYMSPEALSGDGYDAKSDVWALGCIVYELCVLKKPFRGSSLVGVCSVTPPHPPF
jgi:serine/threonine protein kinase